MNVEQTPMIMAGITEQVPQFETYPLAGAALAVAAAGVALAIERRNFYREAEESLVYPDPDQTERAVRSVRREKFAKVAGIGLATAAAAGFMFNEAEPYTEQSRGSVENVAVIVDTSYGAYAEDVKTADGQTIRLAAAVNGIKNLDGLSDVTVSFIAAGAKAESMGEIKDGAGKVDVVDAFEEYVADYSNKSDYDLSGALHIAEAIEPDKVLIIGPTDETNSSLLKNEAAEDQNIVSTIALGTPGSKVTYLGKEVEAPYSKKSNDAVVGAEDSYAAESVKELQDVVSEIVNEQYVQTERVESKLFEKMRDGAAGLLVGSVIFGAVNTMRNRRRRNGKN